MNSKFLLMAKKKDAFTGSADASSLRRSSRDASSRKQPISSPVNSRKSERSEKHTSPSPSPIKSKLDKIEKQMGSSPLRRSDRGKKLVEIPNLPNTKSAKEKTANTSKQSPEDVNDDKKTEKQDPSVGGRKRKRFTAIRYKALFKPQRIRIESDDDEVPEVEGKSPQANTSMNEDVDKELKTQNSIRVQGAPDKDNKALLEGSVIDLDQIEHGDCPQTKSLDGKSITRGNVEKNIGDNVSQTKSLDGKSIASGYVEKKIGDNVSPSNGNVAVSDNHMFHKSSDRIEHDLGNQQEPDTCHKATGTCKAAGSMENAENNDVSTNMQNSKFVEFWVPVQISNVQLEQYCATLLSNAVTLRSSSKSDTLGALENLFATNRKCCNHPYIMDPELQYTLMKDKEQSMMLDVDIKASGKLQFLDHVLPEIQRRQLRVLILFQLTSGTLSGCRPLGKILVDYVHQRFGQNSYEHVFGTITTKKQAAINMFNKEMSRFIFLLESHSCHPSIKLSSVDVIIIFDSELNPSNDLKSLQKISINSQADQIMIFRLYTSSTLEERILKLAENNMAIDAKSQNLRSNCGALLTWGASELFDKLTEFHSQTGASISSEESLLKDVVEEFLYIISHKCKRDITTSKATIIQVQNYGNYGKSIPLQSEIKTHLPEGEQPYIFWRKLLEGQSPIWKFVSESTPRQRKRPSYILDSPPNGKSGVDGGGVKTRRKTVNNNTIIESAQLKTVIEWEIGGVNGGVPATNKESQSSSGNQVWSAEVNNEKRLLDLLKPTVSELCSILKFSEYVKNIVERFLEFVIDHYRVDKKHTRALQALMISLCWIGSSLGNNEIDRSVSFALAKEHFNFSCMENDVDIVCKKLEPAKEKFLENEFLDYLKDIIPAPEETKLEINKSRHIPNVDAFETHESHENVSGKGKEELVKIKGEWNKKRVNLENEYKLEKSIIHEVYSNPSIRSEKLKKLEREFANKLEELERLCEIHLEDLKATMMATEGHVAAEREFSFHGSQYEAQVMHSGNPEVAPTLSENPIDAQGHDVPVCEGANDIESTGSHTSEKERVDTPVSSEQIGEVPALHLGDYMEVDVAEKVDPSHENAKGGISSPHAPHAVEDHNETGANDMAPHIDSGDIVMPAGGYSKENDEDNTVSLNNSHFNKDRHNTIDDAAQEVEYVEIYANEPDVCDNHNETNPNDELPHVESAEMGMQAGTCEKENSENGEIYLDKPDVCDDHNESRPRSYVGSVGMRMPAGTCDKKKAEGGEINLEKPDVDDDHMETSPNDALPRVKSAEMAMPAGICDKENLEDGEIYPDKADVCDDHDETSPRPYAEMGTPAGTCDKENAEDGEINPDKPDVGDDHMVASPNEVLPPVESAEMGTPAGICNKENLEDGEIYSDKPEICDYHNETSPRPHDASVGMGAPAGTCDKENAEDGEVNPDKPDIGDDHMETSPNDVLPPVEFAVMGTPAGICDKENLEDGEINPDIPDVGANYNEISTNDVLPRVDSAEMATPADNEENAEDSNIRTDALHVNEDRNDSCDSISCNPVCAAISQDKTPSVQPVFSPALDHLESIIPEVQNEPLQLEQLPDNGVQDEQINIGDLQLAGAGQLDRIILDEEPDFPSTDPVVVENPSDMLQPNRLLLEPTCEEPTLTASQSGEDLEENLVAAETPHEEHQPHLATSVAPVPPLNALNMFDNIINQVSSQIPNHTDPLQAEVERLYAVKDKVTKCYQETKLRLNSECEKEIAEIVAQISLKYEAKHLETDAAYSSKKMELETNINRVTMNKILAEAFRSKCQDLTPSGHLGTQQVSQAGLMQQLRMLSVSPPMRHLHGAPSPSSSPGQSLGNQQPPQPSLSLPQPPPLQQPQIRPQQPLQIVHQQAALFSSRPPSLSRPSPPMVNQTSSTPPTTSRQLPITPSGTPTTSRLPSTVNQITPSTTPSTSRPRPAVNPITPSSTPTASRLPSGINTMNPSNLTNRSPPSIAQIDMSAANLRINTETRGQSPHMRPMVSSEPRAPAPHMRPLVSNEPRAPAPHLRSLPSSEYRAPAPHIRPFRSVLPRQHVTSGPSQSPVMPPPSTSSPQSLTPLPSEPFIVPPQPPPSEPCTVPLSPPSTTTPLLSSFANLNGLVDNAPRWVNIVTPQPDVRSQIDQLDISDFIREGTAPSSSAHDLVCLSDDD